MVGAEDERHRKQHPTLKMGSLGQWCWVQGSSRLQLGGDRGCLGICVGLHTCIGLRKGQVTAALWNNCVFPFFSYNFLWLNKADKLGVDSNLLKLEMNEIKVRQWARTAAELSMEPSSTPSLRSHAQIEGWVSCVITQSSVIWLKKVGFHSLPSGLLLNKF